LATKTSYQETFFFQSLHYPNNCSAKWNCQPPILFQTYNTKILFRIQVPRTTPSTFRFQSYQETNPPQSVQYLQVGSIQEHTPAIKYQTHSEDLSSHLTPANPKNFEIYPYISQIDTAAPASYRSYPTDNRYSTNKPDSVISNNNPQQPLLLSEYNNGLPSNPTKKRFNSMFQSDMKSSIPDIDEQQQQMELYDDYDGDTNTKVIKKNFFSREKLRYTALQNIVENDSESSKRAIQEAAEKAFGKYYNVVCGAGFFSYIAHTDEYCLVSILGINCYAFSPVCNNHFINFKKSKLFSTSKND
uniref:Ground-like domain-containing protein n=1 Tax=Enterobius vermicularis TaxID=51028 RepID=A0A0N4V6U4_ENTVE